jgi:hypothetical protein
LALWIVDGTTYILSVSLPGNENRNDLFRRLLQELTLKGFEAETVFFDAWYAASETLNLLQALGWTYVSRIKSNRTFNKQALEKLSFHGAQGQCGKVMGGGRQTKADAIHLGVGVLLHKQVGDTVTEGETLVELYGGDHGCDEALALVKGSVSIE